MSIVDVQITRTPGFGYTNHFETEIKFEEHVF